MLFAGLYPDSCGSRAWGLSLLIGPGFELASSLTTMLVCLP